jgi:hypothetical protein
MRIARKYSEAPPDPDPRVARDLLYAEVRNIAEMAERLAHRSRRVAVKLAQLPLPQTDENAQH